MHRAMARVSNPPMSTAKSTLHRIDSDLASSAETLAQRAASRLRAALMRGDFLPGTASTLRGLAERLGTSIMPVREAVSRLAAEQALDLQPNRCHRRPGAVAPGDRRAAADPLPDRKRCRGARRRGRDHAKKSTAWPRSPPGCGRRCAGATCTRSSRAPACGRCSSPVAS